LRLANHVLWRLRGENQTGRMDQGGAACNGCR
jgi:hypothetical protein